MKEIKNTRNELNYTMRIAAFVNILLITVLSVMMSACSGGKEPPVYTVTAERMYEGSLYYASSDCAKCHGVKWDGDGPDATRLKKIGLTPTNFTRANPDRSPADYFQAITGPAVFFQSHPAAKSEEGGKELSRMAVSHAYLAYTDRARWAVANYLFSLNGPVAEKDQEKHDTSLERGARDTERAYASGRNWEVGYTRDTTASPDLNTLIPKAGIVEEESLGQVSDERRIVSLEFGRGADLYRNNCAQCHGNYGQGGVSSIRFGLIPEAKSSAILNRQRAVHLTAVDFAQSPALGSVNAFKDGHTNGGVSSAYQNFADEDWQELYVFVKRLAGK